MRTRKVTFDLMVLGRLLTDGNAFVVKNGLPKTHLILESEIKGNVIEMKIGSVDFADDNEKEIDIKIDQLAEGSY